MKKLMISLAVVSFFSISCVPKKIDKRTAVFMKLEDTQLKLTEKNIHSKNITIEVPKSRYSKEQTEEILQSIKIKEIITSVPKLNSGKENSDCKEGIAGKASALSQIEYDKNNKSWKKTATITFTVNSSKINKKNTTECVFIIKSTHKENDLVVERSQNITISIL